MKHILCRKCRGVGKIPNFKHVEDGICFTCNGSRFEEVDDDAVDEVAILRKKRRLSKETEKEFDSLFKEHREKMSNGWMHYISGISGTNNKFVRLKNYLNYVEEMKIRIKEIDINSEHFFDDYKLLTNDLSEKYMLLE